MASYQIINSPAKLADVAIAKARTNAISGEIQRLAEIARAEVRHA